MRSRLPENLFGGQPKFEQELTVNQETRQSGCRIQAPGYKRKQKEVFGPDVLKS